MINHNDINVEKPNNGYAFVKFHERYSAELAAKKLHKSDYCNYCLEVKFLLPPHWPTEKTRRFY